MPSLRRFIDIGANLTDGMYNGIYNGTKKHDPDLNRVLARSWSAGLDKIIITGGSLEESKRALEIANTDGRLYATVGCHPTRCLEFDEKAATPEDYLDNLKKIVRDGGDKIVAIGECGLDYERMQFCPKETQKKYFLLQLQLADHFKLPLFLHCRKAADDLHAILSQHNYTGVVHSFDGTPEEATRFIELGYYIGLNGCSLKTVENLNAVRQLPIDKVLIETDCPWCDIRPGHAGYKFIQKENIAASVKKEKWNASSMVKGRNEPSNIRQTLDIIAAVKIANPDTLCEQFYANTSKLFFGKINS